MRLIRVEDYGVGAIAITFRLLAEREPVESISHIKMPTMEEHSAFLRSSPYFAWYIIQTEDVMYPVLPIVPVGACLITFNNEIGISIKKEYRRRGHAREALVMLLNLCPPQPAKPGRRAGHFIANINPNNEASIKLFTGLGARHIQNTYQFD